MLKKYIKIIKKSDKLNHVKIELFEIIKNIKNTNYEFKLSNNIKLKYSVFHVLFLKSAHLNTSENILSDEYVESQKKYEIEEILNSQLIND